MSELGANSWKLGVTIPVTLGMLASYAYFFNLTYLKSGRVSTKIYDILLGMMHLLLAYSVCVDGAIAAINIPGKEGLVTNLLLSQVVLSYASSFI